MRRWTNGIRYQTPGVFDAKHTSDDETTRRCVNCYRLLLECIDSCRGLSFCCWLSVIVSTAVPIHLLGFSKGGIVLNQLVTELVRCSFNKKRSVSGQHRQGSAFASTRQFFSSVRSCVSDFVYLFVRCLTLWCYVYIQVNSIHWLDPGNGSLRGAMPTDDMSLSVLSRYEYG